MSFSAPPDPATLAHAVSFCLPEGVGQGATEEPLCPGVASPLLSDGPEAGRTDRTTSITHRRKRSRARLSSASGTSPRSPPDPRSWATGVARTTEPAPWTQPGAPDLTWRTAFTSDLSSTARVCSPGGRGVQTCACPDSSVSCALSRDLLGDEDQGHSGSSQKAELPLSCREWTEGALPEVSGPPGPPSWSGGVNRGTEGTQTAAESRGPTPGCLLSQLHPSGVASGVHCWAGGVAQW